MTTSSVGIRERLAALLRDASVATGANWKLAADWLLARGVSLDTERAGEAVPDTPAREFSDPEHPTYHECAGRLVAGTVESCKYADHRRGEVLSRPAPRDAGERAGEAPTEPSEAMGLLRELREACRGECIRHRVGVGDCAVSCRIAEVMGRAHPGDTPPHTLRKDDTPEGKKIWDAVDQAAARAPQWAKDRLGVGDTPHPDTVGYGTALQLCAEKNRRVLGHIVGPDRRPCEECLRAARGEPPRTPAEPEGI